MILPINNDSDECMVLNKQWWVYTQPIGNTYKNIAECNINGLPLPSNVYKSVPMVVLVQSAFMNPKFKWVSLKHIHFTSKTDENKLNDLFSFRINKYKFGKVENILDSTVPKVGNFDETIKDQILIERDDLKRWNSSKNVTQIIPDKSERYDSTLENQIDKVLSPPTLLSRYKSLKHIGRPKAYFNRIKNNAPKWLIKFDKHLFTEFDTLQMSKSKYKDQKLRPLVGFSSDQVHKHLLNYIKHSKTLNAKRQMYYSRWKQYYETYKPHIIHRSDVINKSMMRNNKMYKLFFTLKMLNLFLKCQNW